MSVPEQYLYTSQHEWLALDGQRATVGITAYAADALGDVVFMELPEVGAELQAGEPCGELESTKSVSELFAPADGVVFEVNDAVAQEPARLNTDPYEAGWLFRMDVAGTPDLLEPAAYEELIGDA